MSLIDQARDELRRANFGEEGSVVMLDILNRFFEEWDSGGAVAVASDVLVRLIAGQPLGPLTGADDEWFDHGDGVFQNLRCSSVFKDPRFHEGELAYDLDNPAGARAAISFPYDPITKTPAMPVFEIGHAEETP